MLHYIWWAVSETKQVFGCQTFHLLPQQPVNKWKCIATKGPSHRCFPWIQNQPVGEGVWSCETRTFWCLARFSYNHARCETSLHKSLMSKIANETTRRSCRLPKWMYSAQISAGEEWRHNTGKTLRHTASREAGDKRISGCHIVSLLPDPRSCIPTGGLRLISGLSLSLQSLFTSLQHPSWHGSVQLPFGKPLTNYRCLVTSITYV